MNEEKLTEEQAAKLKECKSKEEYLEIAKEIGLELDDADLEQFAGGLTDKERREYYKKIVCPACGASAQYLYAKGVGYSQIGPTQTIGCRKCGCEFNIKYPH